MPAPAFAGAWPQKAGEGLIINTSLLDRADNAWDESGQRNSDGFFYKDETSIFAEYGLTERYTLVGRIAWQNVRRRNGLNLDSAQGFSASEIGVRRVVWRGEKQIVSLQALALIPGEGENVSNQPLGDGGQAFEARALWGWSLNDDVFTDTQIAWRSRNESDLDEARLDLTLGWRPGERWLLLAQSFSVWSIEPARPGAPEFEQHKLQMSVGREWGRREYHIGGYITPTGRNSIEERALFISVWQRF